MKEIAAHIMDSLETPQMNREYPEMDGQEWRELQERLDQDARDRLGIKKPNPTSNGKRGKRSASCSRRKLNRVSRKV